MSLTKVSYSMIAGAVANIIDYGADPTGSENSTTAIQAALDAADSVYIPPGTFKITTIRVDAAQRLFGSGMYESVLQIATGSNAPGVVLVNTDPSGANVPFTTQIDNFQVRGQIPLNPSLVNQVGVLVTCANASGGLNIVKFLIDRVAVTYMAAEGIVLNGSTGSTITNCDIQYNCASGIRLSNSGVITTGPVPCFNNGIRIDKCRIKHNAIGVYCQGFAVQGITGAPSGGEVSEVWGNSVTQCLIEANLTSPSTGDIFDYPNGIGGPNRPGIGLLLENAREWVITDNWIESQFASVKFNGGCKLSVIQDNKFSNLSPGSQIAPAPDQAGNIVFYSYSGILENVRNIVTKNLFAVRNTRVGGIYEGQHILLINTNNGSNRFIHNRQEYFDGLTFSTSLVVTPGADYADRQLIVDMNVIEGTNYVKEYSNSLTETIAMRVLGVGGEFDLYDSSTTAAKINVGNTGFALDHACSFNFRQIDADGVTLEDRKAIKLAARYDAGNTYDTVFVMKGRGTPESAITAGVGSLYMRTDGGAGTSLYVKESGSGNTGWVGK
jgi:hypothetical protein